MENPLKDHLFHKQQYAYRPGTSTVEALHTLVSKLEKAVLNSQIAIAVFLDIAGAFDNTRTKSMVRALQKRGVSESIVRWIGYMLRFRIAETSTLGCEKEKRVTQGCPQGGILSPLLWNLVVDSLLQINDMDRAVHTQAYADDVTPLSIGIDPLTVSEKIQRTLDRLEEWAAEHSLSFSPSKTVVMMFTRKRVVKPPLFLCGQRLTYHSEVKYLGVILNTRLTWTPHVKAVTRRALTCLAQCRRAVGATWGMTPKAMKWIYTAVVRPIIEYACIIWCPSLTLVTTQKRLAKVQRSACAAITSPYPSTPSAALDTILDIPPLHVWLQGAALKAAHRMRLRGNWLGVGTFVGSSKSHVDKGNKLLKATEELNFPVDLLPVVHRNFEPPYQVIIPERDHYKENPLPSLESNHSEVICYTDGSKTDDGTGSGFVIRGNGISEDEHIALGSYPTVFQSEVLAISAAAERLLRHSTEHTTITFYSDSQAALKALEPGLIRSRLVKECSDSLHGLARANQVTVKWIPGHEGHVGNERADEKAREGSSTKLVGPEPAIPVSLTLIRSAINREVDKCHEKEWKNRIDCRESKIFCQAPCKRRAQRMICLPRQEIRSIIQIMTGHANLAKHRHRCKKLASPLCPSCRQEEESGFHHLAICIRYVPQRLSAFGQFRLAEDDLRNIEPQSIAAFLKATKRLENFGVT